MDSTFLPAFDLQTLTGNSAILLENNWAPSNVNPAKSESTLHYDDQ
jgi:hypothetical protein